MIKDFNNQYILLLNEALQHWTENDSVAYAMQYLESINKPETNKILANYYLSTGDLTNASLKFNSLPINSPDDVDYLNLNTMLINLATDSLTPFDMDSSQVAYVRNLAYSSSQSQAANNARAILWLVYGEEFEDIIDTNINSNKSGFIFNDNSVQNESIVAETGETYIYHIPNPAKSRTTFYYRLPEKTDNALISLYDITGKKLKSFILSVNNNSVEIDLSDIPSGTYYYMLKANENIIMYKKLIKTND